jgi:hypothetical protein
MATNDESDSLERLAGLNETYRRLAYWLESATKARHSRDARQRRPQELTLARASGLSPL